MQIRGSWQPTNRCIHLQNLPHDRLLSAAFAIHHKKLKSGDCSSDGTALPRRIYPAVGSKIVLPFEYPRKLSGTWQFALSPRRSRSPLHCHLRDGALRAFAESSAFCVLLEVGGATQRHRPVVVIPPLSAWTFLPCWQRPSSNSHRQSGLRSPKSGQSGIDPLLACEVDGLPLERP